MILFVDDEPRRVENYIEELEANGYEVDFQRGVGQASKVLETRSTEVELLVLDIMMAPGSLFTLEETREGLDTGIRFLEHVRLSWPDLPVIFLTNRAGSVSPDLVREPKLLVIDKHQVLPTEFPDEVKHFLAR